jgi:hypothetical protein
MDLLGASFAESDAITAERLMEITRRVVRERQRRLARAEARTGRLIQALAYQRVTREERRRGAVCATVARRPTKVPRRHSGSRGRPGGSRARRRCQSGQDPGADDGQPPRRAASARLPQVRGGADR